MKKFIKIFVVALLLSITATQLKAQNFIAKAQVEYEVRTNIKKTMGTGFFADMMNDKLADFKTGYYKYIYNDNKSIFKFDRWAPNTLPAFLKNADEEMLWYSDFDAGEITARKNIVNSNFMVKDSLRKINWKLTNENMMIAGFNCRKAEAVVFDSVYIFAYYSEELMIPGGPVSINGLPGLILGLTIPRMYTSYVATKVMVNDVPLKEIKPPLLKKTYTYQALKLQFIEITKDWRYSDNDEGRKENQMLLWNVQL